ncbi:hypothetical protein MCEREM21A_02240 [Sphingomonadaceae bacterium]
MATAIGFRSDYTSMDLRRFGRRSGDADLLAIALILDGGSRSEAAKIGASSSISHGASCPLVCASGLMGHDHSSLV